jgi:hypothetical protein
MTQLSDHEVHVMSHGIEILYRQKNKMNIGELSKEVYKYHTECCHLRILELSSLSAVITGKLKQQTTVRLSFNTRHHGMS